MPLAGDRLLIWIGGEQLDAGEMTADAIRLMGRALGISPAEYLTPETDLPLLSEGLARAARVLGYAAPGCATPGTRKLRVEIEARLTAAVDGLSHDLLVAWLAPTVNSHKAAPPGACWDLSVYEFTPPSSPSGGLRVESGEYRRNHLNPAVNVLLRDDAELAVGARIGADATLWFNLDESVACVDQSTLILAVGDVLVTPRLVDGAIDCSARYRALFDYGVTEIVIDQPVLESADAGWCLAPWGAIEPISSLCGRALSLRDLRSRSDGFVR